MPQNNRNSIDGIISVTAAAAYKEHGDRFTGIIFPRNANFPEFAQ